MTAASVRSRRSPVQPFSPAAPSPPVADYARAADGVAMALGDPHPAPVGRIPPESARVLRPTGARRDPLCPRLAIAPTQVQPPLQPIYVTSLQRSGRRADPLSAAPMQPTPVAPPATAALSAAEPETSLLSRLSRLARLAEAVIGDPWRAGATVNASDPSILRMTSLQRSPQRADPFTPHPARASRSPQAAAISVSPAAPLLPLSWHPTDPLAPDFAATFASTTMRQTSLSSSLTLAQTTAITAPAPSPEHSRPPSSPAIPWFSQMARSARPHPMTPPTAIAPSPFRLAIVPRSYGIDPFLSLRAEIVNPAIAADPLLPTTARPALPEHRSRPQPLLAAGDPLVPTDPAIAPPAKNRSWLRVLSNWFTPSHWSDRRSA